MLHSSNSLTHYAKGTRSLAYGAPTACRHAVSGSISLLCQRCFSPFPYGTCSLSVICVYLALERWSSQLPAGYHVSHRTQVPTCLLQNFTYGTITLYGTSFHIVRLFIRIALLLVLQPHESKLPWFGLIPVRSPLLRESLLFSVPLGTEMFQFPRLPRHTYVFGVP